MIMARYEQAPYSVVLTAGDYEIRSYDSYLAAETEVTGDFDSTGNTAFARLAGFIFGRNSDGMRMNMTVPVTRQETESHTYRYRFVMESAYSESMLPRPLEDSVEIVRVPAGHFAAIRYRGRRNEALYKRMERRLLEALERDGMSPSGASFSAVYDGPTNPPMLRRNEVLVPVEWSTSTVAPGT